MKATKILNRICLLTLLVVSASCGKYTDISPKGKNLLDRVSDLDLLLNHRYAGNGFDFLNQSVLVNDMYPQVTNVPNLINGNVRNIPYVMVTYDETIDRVALTATDNPYDRLYPVITNVANIVLENVDQASGDRQLAQQLKAEAYVIRAYLHYLLVNIYAKAYNPATASTDGGIPYVNDIDFETVNAKNTVQEVYDKMLTDVDAALALNALPDYPKNSMRVGKAFAHGVKARILLSMRDYEGALSAAETALTLNSTLEDHRPFLPAPTGQGLPVARDGVNAADNLFHAYFGELWPLTFTPSLEIVNQYFEEGNIIMDHTSTYNYVYGYAFSGLEGVPAFFASNYKQNSAGMTTSDLFLIKAESLIRTGRVPEGIEVLNYIRQHRIYPYTAIGASDEGEAMQYLKKLARIEFLYTWRNFVDIKRWNTESNYAETITRTVNGVTYTLRPDSPLWIFPFPMSATDFNHTLTQNF